MTSVVEPLVEAMHPLFVSLTFWDWAPTTAAKRQRVVAAAVATGPRVVNMVCVCVQAERSGGAAAERRAISEERLQAERSDSRTDS